MSHKMKQVEAVYVTTMNVLAEKGVPFDDGQNVSDIVTKEIRSEIIAVLVNGFETDQIEFSADAKAKYFSTDRIKTYVNGLVSNWFRKDPRLNGGVKHQPKHPGSRAGSGDEQIKALKALRKLKLDDAEALAAIDTAIANRTAELQPKATLTQEQIDNLPFELRQQLGL